MAPTIEGIPEDDVRFLLKDAKKGLESETLDKKNKAWDDVEFKERERMRSNIYDSIKCGHPWELARYNLEKEENEEKNKDRMHKLCCSAYKSIYRKIHDNKVGHSLH